MFSNEEEFFLMFNPFGILLGSLLHHSIYFCDAEQASTYLDFTWESQNHNLCKKKKKTHEKTSVQTIILNFIDSYTVDNRF